MRRPIQWWSKKDRKLPLELIRLNSFLDLFFTLCFYEYLVVLNNTIGSNAIKKKGLTIVGPGDG